MTSKKFNRLVELASSVASKVVIGFHIIVYIVPLLIFRYSLFIKRNLLFMHRFNRINLEHLTEPEVLGLDCVRQLRISHDQNNNYIDKTNQKSETPSLLSAWHILPKSRRANFVIDETNRGDEFADSRPIVLYVHGNGGTRANPHRLELYKRLVYEHDYHVITFDYRGFADSDYMEPTADSLTSDAQLMYKWLLDQPLVENNRVFVWSHSLGTAIAIRMLSGLPSECKPKGLVLEAPLDTIANAILLHPWTKPFKNLPHHEYFLSEPIADTAELNFNSVELIGDIKSIPMMIIHAEDDEVLPFELGCSLYKTAVEKLGKSQVEFVPVNSCEQAGHNLIYAHRDTMLKTKRFIDALSS